MATGLYKRGMDVVLARAARYASAVTLLKRRPTVRRRGVEALEARRLFAAASFDPYWTGDGIAQLSFPSEIAAVAPLSNGKLIVAGRATRGGETDLLVARLSSNGQLDPSFGGGDGWVTVDVRDDDAATSVAIAPSGRVLVAGHAGGDESTLPGVDLVVVRLSADGALDPSFDGDGVARRDYGDGYVSNDFARDVLVTPDERVVVVGETKTDAFTANLLLARFNANGSSDAAFGGYGNGSLQLNVALATRGMTIARAANGSLLVGGGALTETEINGTAYDASYDLALFRFGANGLLDSSFGDSGGYTLTNVGFSTSDESGQTEVIGHSNDTIYDLAIDAGGDIVAVAQTRYLAWFFDPFADQTLARYSSNGLLEATARDAMGDEEPNLVYASSLAIYGGKIVTSGFAQYGDIYVARYDLDLSPDDTFNPNPSAGDGSHFVRHFTDVYDSSLRVGMAVGGDGKIYVGGTAYGTDDQIGTVLRLINSFVDPDDQIVEAPTIALDTARLARLFVGDDVNLVKFTGEAGQTIAFDVDRAADSGLNSYLRLFDANGAQIAANDDAAAPGEALRSDAYLSHQFTAGGIYYVGVSATSNRNYSASTGRGDSSGSWGGYTLSTVASPDTDDRLASARPLAIGATVQAGIAQPDDVDLFAVTVQAGHRLGFDVDASNGSPLDGYLRLFDAAGNQLASNDNGVAPGEQSNRSPYLSRAVATAGTYYVGISSRGNASYNPVAGNGYLTGESVGDYTLLVTLVS